MNPLPHISRAEKRLEEQLEEKLGGLAMRFRGTRSDEERGNVAREYTKTVTSLIRSGSWLEMPAPEDQLPDDWMPKAFFEYWSHR